MLRGCRARASRPRGRRPRSGRAATRRASRTRRPSSIASSWRCRPGRTCRVTVGQHTFLGHHRVHLRLEPGAQLHQLGPIADQLAQLPRSPAVRSTPPAADPAATCRPDRSRRVTSFFTRRSPQFNARRVRQMHRRAQLLQQIDRPIPAIGRFDHHLRRRRPPRATAVEQRATDRCRSVHRPAARPPRSSRTITERRRWKSIPTYCRSIGASSSSTRDWL